MDTPFDITQKPLSAAELELRRNALSDQIAASNRRLRVHGWILAALAAAVLAASIAGNAHWGWLPWVYFAVVAVVAVDFSVVSAVPTISNALVTLSALIVVVCVIGVVGSASVAVDDLAALTFGIVSIVSIVGIATGTAVRKWLSKQEDRIKPARIALAALSDADRAVCLEIKEWLEDDIIRQYRDWVQEEGRVFTLGEVEAMRTYWDARALRQAEAKRAADIDVACREVYVDSLIKS
ncbi:hypothetical protein [Marinobacterium sp. BA1]|uniref:hypothetical protein n=1 Tax=Marinobacterium sp. BA1 TaxID=3138931 RepID=UPI0032E57B3E